MAAPSSVQLFATNLGVLNLADLVGTTIKLALFTSAASFDTSLGGTTTYSNTDELATANGYTQGGVTLDNVNVGGYEDSGFSLSTDDAIWTATGGAIPAWRYGVLYVSGSLWGMTDPVLGLFIGDATPADVPETTDGSILRIYCPADGWLRALKE